MVRMVNGIVLFAVGAAFGAILISSEPLDLGVAIARARSLSMSGESITNQEYRELHSLMRSIMPRAAEIPHESALMRHFLDTVRQMETYRERQETLLADIKWASYEAMFSALDGDPHETLRLLSDLPRFKDPILRFLTSDGANQDRASSDRLLRHIEDTEPFKLIILMLPLLRNLQYCKKRYLQILEASEQLDEHPTVKLTVEFIHDDTSAWIQMGFMSLSRNPDNRDQELAHFAFLVFKNELDFLHLRSMVGGRITGLICHSVAFGALQKSFCEIAEKHGLTFHPALDLDATSEHFHLATMEPVFQLLLEWTNLQLSQSVVDTSLDNAVPPSNGFVDDSDAQEAQLQTVVLTDFQFELYQFDSVSFAEWRGFCSLLSRVQSIVNEVLYRNQQNLLNRGVLTAHDVPSWRQFRTTLKHLFDSEPDWHIVENVINKFKKIPSSEANILEHDLLQIAPQTTIYLREVARVECSLEATRRRPNYLQSQCAICFQSIPSGVVLNVFELLTLTEAMRQTRDEELTEDEIRDELALLRDGTIVEDNSRDSIDSFRSGVPFIRSAIDEAVQVQSDAVPPITFIAQVPLDLVFCGECSTRFCRSCVEKSLRDSACRCPLCRTTIVMPLPETLTTVFGDLPSN